MRILIPRVLEARVLKAGLSATCWLAGLLAGLIPSQGLSAQSPLTTTYVSNNGGPSGGMVYVDLLVTEPQGITVKQVDINTGSSQGELVVYVASGGGYATIAATPSAWLEVARGNVRTAGIGAASAACLGEGFYLAPGSHAMALRGATLGQRYLAGGAGLQLVYATAELRLTNGAASNQPWGGAQFEPRVWNGSLHYEVGQTSGYTCAYAATFGDGCGGGATTWYESFSDLAGFDLAGSVAAPNVLRATVAGATGYVVLPGVPAWHAPLGTQVRDNDPTAPGDLDNEDVSEPLQLPFAFPFPGGGSTSVVHAAANGWVQLGATAATTSFALASAGTLLSGPARLAPLWCNLDPAANNATNPASGVYFDVDPQGSWACITWLDVGDARTGPPLPGSTSVNLQCVLFQNGDFEFRYRDLVTGPGIGPALVGWSRGAQAGILPDPGGADLSQSLPLVTNGPDNFALTHEVGSPQLGTSFALSVAQVEALAPIAFLIAGDAASPLGVDLAPLGAIGCRAYGNALATAAVPVAGVPGSGTFSLAIPSTAALSGASLVSQYAAFTLRNALNLSTSNGAIWTIGS